MTVTAAHGDSQSLYIYMVLLEMSVIPRLFCRECHVKLKHTYNELSLKCKLYTDDLTLLKIYKSQKPLRLGSKRFLASHELKYQ